MAKTKMASRSVGYGKPLFTTETLVNLETMAQDRELPAWYRVVLLARARANLWQHAAFEPGELAERLDVDRSTIWRAIGKAKKRGHIAPASTALCIALDRSRYLRGWATVRQCTEPKHVDLRNLEWHSGYGKWGWWDWQPFEMVRQEAERRNDEAAQIRRAASLVAERVR